MTLRRATSGDAAAIDRFLLGRVESSMFPLANLREHGIDGPAPRSMRFWLNEGPAGPRQVFGLTREGMAMPQMPGAAAADWRAVAAALAGRRLIGVLGEAGQVRACLAATGLTGAPTLLDHDEPAFTLDLGDLRIPARPDARLDPAAQADRALLVGWRRAYHTEVLGTPAADAEARAEQDIAGFLARGTHRILRIGAQPVAMTGFNATLPDTVQIGAVFTPPELRGRGYARLAVALHLQEARRAGVTRAVLFAASDAAAKAYRAIGFARWGSFALVLFDGAQQVAPCPA
ncbi:MAG: GNAT family N-acetyltransferase [Confluentimicrobium sp.]|uniref:GNAT family N-acetyltransferase n=1 Tax=Actibacterium sp. TaxID=1872125 RepID=UPI000C5F49D8|nr:GNAT family N-acetyltransferase [Actibacterium sp.]MBC58335.1 GNAT family N-acetyltransferase [Actibacterium sp.]